MNEEINNFKKFSELVKDISIAMMTTLDRDGNLTSRPMATTEVEYDGTLWFFANLNSVKVDEINNESNVNLTYAHSAKNIYVSVSGKAEVMKDQEKIKSLWKPIYKAWFPKGLDDPALTLIRVQVKKADYWDIPSSKLIQIIGFAKAIVTGTSYAPGTHGHIE